jgi:hypothetical protein
MTGWLVCRFLDRCSRCLPTVAGLGFGFHAPPSPAFGSPTSTATATGATQADALAAQRLAFFSAACVWRDEHPGTEGLGVWVQLEPVVPTSPMAGATASVANNTSGVLMRAQSGMMILRSKRTMQ